MLGDFLNTKIDTETTDMTILTNTFGNGDDFVIDMKSVEEIIINKNRENANVPHTPESTSSMIAGLIKRDYAFKRVYDENVVRLHKLGDLYIHDLTRVDEPYCGSHSPAYVAKFGLSLPNHNSIAKPAKHADVLIEQLIKFASTLQGHFSGAIGFDAVNMFLAPYIVGMSDEKVEQLAQILIFEFAQQVVSRGGQATFSDLNLYWGTPKHYAEVSAIGPGGVDLGIPYKEYSDESKRFLRALMKVYTAGDGAGRPFFFPKADCHIDEESVKDDEYMNMLGGVASKMGSPYFIFDRGENPQLAQCCRLRLQLDKGDVAELVEPWKLRFSALQNVSMNLPGIAYRNKNSESTFLDELFTTMDAGKVAHINKMNLIFDLLNMGADGPLHLLCMDNDGLQYFRPEKMKFLIGVVGLNEAVEMLCGEQLHESKDAFMLGTKILSNMQAKCKEITNEVGYTCILEQTPAETTAYRFASMDRKRYDNGIEKYFRGNLLSGGIYYTNSSYLNINAPTGAIERIKMEGKMHPFIDAGAITHVWLGEHAPPAEGIANIVRKTFHNTSNAQVAFSPEFTSCNSCNKTSRGLSTVCEYCGSTNVDGITRVTGYFSKISSWNISKVQELKDRHKYII